MVRTHRFKTVTATKGSLRLKHFTKYLTYSTLFNSQSNPTGLLLSLLYRGGGKMRWERSNNFLNNSQLVGRRGGTRT